MDGRLRAAAKASGIEGRDGAGRHVKGADSFQDNLRDVGFEGVTFCRKGLTAGTGWYGAVGVCGGGENDVVCNSSAGETAGGDGKSEGEGEVG